MVSIRTTTETVTPKYPMTLRETETCGSCDITGLALRRIAKCVRWVHSHTVERSDERASFLMHPLVDHSARLSTLLLYK